MIPSDIVIKVGTMNGMKWYSYPVVEGLIDCA